jgi:hypothetical protein
MCSVSNKCLSVGGKRVFWAAVFLGLVISAANAQNQIPMDQAEFMLQIASFPFVPQSEFHRVFQQFIAANYRGRTFIYEREIQSFSSSFMQYVSRNGTTDAWLKKYYSQEQEQVSRAPAFPATHQLTTDTKLYTEQDFNSAVVASLGKGTAVQLKEYGGYTDISGETAKWAQVSTAEGQTGWVFSGYLGPK